MKKIHFMSVALMAILVTSIGGLQQASAIMGTNALPSGGSIDLYELLDGSGSIQSGDWTLMKQGLVNSLNAAVTSADYGKLRISVIVFASSAGAPSCQQSINSAADLTTLNTCILALVQPGGGTCMTCAYNSLITELGVSPLTGANDRSIVDLVTDGVPNNQGTTATAVTTAIAAGLDSNIALGVGSANTAFLASITHPGASPGPIDPVPLPDPLVQGFVVTANSFADFEAAMTEKLGGFVGTVVGGELLSIDTTALILAGAQTNAVWLLSALAVIGSVAFGALYITSKKN